MYRQDNRFPLPFPFSVGRPLRVVVLVAAGIAVGALAQGTREPAGEPACSPYAGRISIDTAWEREYVRRLACRQ